MVPAAVRYSIQREVVFVAVGRSSRAWTSSARFADEAGAVKTTMIVLGPEAEVPTVLHECAHAWSRPVDDGTWPAISVEGERGFREYMRAKPETAAVLDRDDEETEAAADSLALSWWYGQPEGAALPA